MTTDQDRRYVRTEGVTLVSGIWGEELDPTKARQVNDRDAFALLWDETASVWVAVYRMCINVGALCAEIFDFLSATHVVLLVAFLSFTVRDPLLCLTASITMRERPVPMTPARAVLAAMLTNAGGLSETQPSVPIESFNDEIDKSYYGLDEVNLLWGLSSGTLMFSFLIVSSALSTHSPNLCKFCLSSFPPQYANRGQNT
jgi:hypothetical protein